MRRDRAAEILSQIRGIETFFYGLCPLHPERHRFTIELVAAFYRALVTAEMRIKHELAVPRPVEFSPQIMPMIQTPGHSSFPGGHAVESFMLATVLSALMQEGSPRFAGWNVQLAQLAARISVNRIIAGVHFPIDMAAGLVSGAGGGPLFRLRWQQARGGNAIQICRRDLRGERVPRELFVAEEILAPNGALPDFVAALGNSFTPVSIDKSRSTVSWLWGQAVEEWK